MTFRESKMPHQPVSVAVDNPRQVLPMSGVEQRNNAQSSQRTRPLDALLLGCATWRVFSLRGCVRLVPTIPLFVPHENGAGSGVKLLFPLSYCPR